MQDTLDGRPDESEHDQRERDNTTDHDLVGAYVWHDSSTHAEWLSEWSSPDLVAGVVRAVRGDVVVIEPFEDPDATVSVPVTEVEPLDPREERLE